MLEVEAVTLSDFLRVVRKDLEEFELEQRKRQLEEPEAKLELPQIGWRKRLLKHLEGEET